MDYPDRERFDAIRLRVSDEARLALEDLSLADDPVIRRMFAELRHPVEQLLALAAD